MCVSAKVEIYVFSKVTRQINQTSLLLCYHCHSGSDFQLAGNPIAEMETVGVDTMRLESSDANVLFGIMALSMYATQQRTA